VVDSTPGNAGSSLFTFIHELKLNLTMKACETVTTQFTEAQILKGEPQPPNEVIDFNLGHSAEDSTPRPTTGHGGKVFPFHHTRCTLITVVNRGKTR
jgi:hypothetical protein